MSEHVYEVRITATDSAGNVGSADIEYRTRLPETASVPDEIATELGKALGREHVRTVNADA